MIETMVDFRPRDLWPRRKVLRSDASAHARAALDALTARGLVNPPPDQAAAAALVDEAVDAALPRVDVALREYAYQRNRGLERALGPSASSIDPDDPATAGRLAQWRAQVAALDRELVGRAAETLTRLLLEEFVARSSATDPKLAALVAEVRARRDRPPAPPRAAAHHHEAASEPLESDPVPALDALQAELSTPFARRLSLWKKDRSELVGFDSELDEAVRTPGWTNVWTSPIQNRVDMLSTGVNTEIGVRVLGARFDDVVRASEAVAEALRKLPGAADVTADPVRGKGYLEARVDRDRASALGVAAADVTAAVEAATRGVVVAQARDARGRVPVRVRYARGDDPLDAALVLARDPSSGAARLVPLRSVAEIRRVEGPATIKGENGLLRNYVRLNARGVAPAELVERARRLTAETVKLPEGVSIEWTGRFENEAHARRTLSWVAPSALLLILGLLYWTYHDLADALLMMLAVPGAIAGGSFVQWLFGFPFSVAAWVGYVACFGMATSTGVIMLVYLRDAVDRAGGLSQLDPASLRQAVIDGAAQRLRPKLLTEGVVLLGLAPMLWAHGVGSEVIRPMAAPVLGGVLIADEVIDLLLPVVFYHVRLRRLRRSPNFLHARAPDAVLV
jgi:Cu(I)/Ag(I) efflux system membrane protein CusA/SilA